MRDKSGANKAWQAKKPRQPGPSRDLPICWLSRTFEASQGYGNFADKVTLGCFKRVRRPDGMQLRPVHKVASIAAS